MMQDAFLAPGPIEQRSPSIRARIEALWSLRAL